MAQDLTTSLALLNGKKDALILVQGQLSGIFQMIQTELTRTQAETQSVVSQLQGVSGVRKTSNVDDYCLNERNIGQNAAIDFIQANPECTEDEAENAWKVAVAAALPVATHDPHGLLALYVKNTFDAGRIQEMTWTAFRAFVAATPKQLLMGM